jgi:hypothetical protein
MKLVTTPSEALPNVAAPEKAGGVMSALRRAATETGADFAYLLKTAMRESSLNPAAEASSSSATGLFQFIEQTWLATVRKYGAEHGLKAYADAIEVGNNGRLQVADRTLRQEILALRKDPETAALMAGEMTTGMRADMEATLGRRVSPGELYVAHFLGPNAATKLIAAAAANPTASAAEMFPQAASANRSIFYAKDGTSRSISSVLASLTSKHETIPGGDTIMAAATESTRATPWRGPAADPSLSKAPLSPFAAFSGDQALVMAPIMVQLLAALDSMSPIAELLATSEPELRRSETDSI